MLKFDKSLGFNFEYQTLKVYQNLEQAIIIKWGMKDDHCRGQF